MYQPGQVPQPIRFGSYEVDVRAGELRKGGLKVKLQEQPFQILCMLLQRPGELVTREELREKLWPNGTFVDFEHSLNTSVKKLREALGDEADNPRFIETLHRRGYRFVAPVEGGRSSVVVTDNPPALQGRAPWRSTRVLLIALLAIAGLTGAIVVWQAFREAPVPKVRGSRRLTSGDNVGVMSTTRSSLLFAPMLTDGSRIYFSEWDDIGRYKVSQVSTAGGEISHLPLSFAAIVLHLSPNNEKLLIREVSENLEGPLWEVSTTGGNPVRLGDAVAQDGAWSPNGKKLLFSRGNELYVANRDGTLAKKLLGLDGRAYWIRWSLDGRRLRFTLVDKNLGISLWEVAEDGTGLHRLLPGWKEEKAQECCGDWSRDGKYFVFTAVQDNHPHAWILPEKEGVLGKRRQDPVQLTQGPNGYLTAIFSQDGKKLFAVSWTKLGVLTKFNLKTREVEPFLKGFRGTMLHYSRDERWITYVDQPRVPDAGWTSGDVWRSRADGTEALQLTSAPLNAIYPRWSPDGKEIVFIGKMPGSPFKLYLIGKDGGTPKQLIDDKRNEIDPDWSPDGRKIIFGRPPDMFAEEGLPKAIQLLDVESGQVSTLPGSQGLFAPKWSRDGRYVFALTVETPFRMLLYDVAAQKWRKLNVVGGDGSWAHDSKSIFATGDGKKGEYPVFRIWIDGRIESIVDLHKISKTTLSGCDCCWNGTAPDNSPFMSCSSFSSDLYALDLDLP